MHDTAWVTTQTTAFGLPIEQVCGCGCGLHRWCEPGAATEAEREWRAGVRPAEVTAEILAQTAAATWALGEEPRPGG